jgi:hypothetical protein
VYDTRAENTTAASIKPLVLKNTDSNLSVDLLNL